MINEMATQKLNTLVRISSIDEARALKDDALLLPKDVEISFLCNNKVKTTGLGEKIDGKMRDLLRIVEIINPLNVEYKSTNILSPRTYIESLTPILQHISVQCILLSRIIEEDVSRLLDLINNTQYGRDIHDSIWIAPKGCTNAIKPGSVVYIMNRRVGGWDGSKERPVIELLGAGGHIGVDSDFRMPDPISTVITEIKEEIGLEIHPNDVMVFGGFHNKMSSELVILCGVFLQSARIPDIQAYALRNYEQDTDGVYLGLFEDVISMYKKDASPFAGGEKAKPTNFPLQKELMDNVITYIRQNNNLSRT